MWTCASLFGDIAAFQMRALILEVRRLRNRLVVVEEELIALQNE
jgi:hypothetical protein